MEMRDSDREVECEWTFCDLGWGETNVTVKDLGEVLEARVVEAAEDEDLDDTDMECVDDGVCACPLEDKLGLIYGFLCLAIYRNCAAYSLYAVV